MIMNFLIFTAQQHKQVINSLKEHKSGGAELTSQSSVELVFIENRDTTGCLASLNAAVWMDMAPTTYPLFFFFLYLLFYIRIQVSERECIIHLPHCDFLAI